MFGHRWLGIALALAVGALPVAPPEHVHESEERGHHRALVHRHLEGHLGGHHGAHYEGELDDDDAPVLTFDAVYTVPQARAIVSVPPVTVVAFGEAPIVNVIRRTPEYFGRLIHGPPRAPAGLRAPPSTTCL